MKIEIDHVESDNVYSWRLWDGPEEIDFYEGTELDIGQCFESIIVKRALNALCYMDNSGVTNFFGSWPGDETDEELLNSLKTQRALAREKKDGN